MKEWQRYKEDEVVYPGRQRVTRKHFRSEDGGTFDFETVGFADRNAATVVAVTALGRAIVARQFRVGPEAIMEECVSGAIEPGETPEDAARRELLEETGYVPGQIEYLGFAHDHPYANMKRHYFIATDCEQVAPPQLDDLERVEIDLISIAELLSNAKTGKMTNGLAVLFAYDKLVELTTTNKSGS